jgi:hypothetical protein
MAKETLYAIVQHSAFGYADDGQFVAGLEIRGVDTEKEKNLVRKVGGKLFAHYGDADDYTMDEMYHEDNPSLIPDAKGTFSEKKIDGLAIYIPAKENANNVA